MIDSERASTVEPFLDERIRERNPRRRYTSAVRRQEEGFEKEIRLNLEKREVDRREVDRVRGEKFAFRDEIAGRRFQERDRPKSENRSALRVETAGSVFKSNSRRVMEPRDNSVLSQDKRSWSTSGSVLGDFQLYIDRGQLPNENPKTSANPKTSNLGLFCTTPLKYDFDRV